MATLRALLFAPHDAWRWLPLGLCLLLSWAPARAASPDAAKPPAWPDATHVPFGCFLSTQTYLSRFQAAYPGLPAQAFSLWVDHALFGRWKHTVALVGWRGEWWVRDEYLGVLATGADAATPPESLAAMIEALLERRARALSRGQRAPAYVVPTGQEDARQRLAWATCAVELAGQGAAIYACEIGREVRYLVYFRPSPDRIAVYDAMLGTTTAECAEQDGIKVVRAVAKHHGFDVQSVRAVDPAGWQVVAR